MMTRQPSLRILALVAAVLVSTFTAFAQSTFRGRGTSDAEALREMRTKVASAYSAKLPSSMLETYSDELKKASRASMDGKTFIRSVSRSEVEAMFIERRDKAVSVRTESQRAEKAGNLGRARMYCYWAIALFKSVPGIEASEIASLQDRYKSLEGNDFPATGASNVGSLAERIYRMEPVKPVPAARKNAREESVEDPGPVRKEYASLPDVGAPANSVTKVESSAEERVDGLLPVEAPSVEAPAFQTAAKPSRRFFTVAGASLVPDLSASLMAGTYLNDAWGFYVKGSSNFSGSSHEYALLQDGMLPDGGVFWGTGDSHVSHWSLTGGAVFMPLLGHRLGFHAGAGYLRRQVVLEDLDGARALSTAASSDGFCADAGLVFNAGRIMLTAGSTVTRKNADLMVGVGVRF